jgi:hypothetical protein
VNAARISTFFTRSPWRLQALAHRFPEPCGIAVSRDEEESMRTTQTVTRAGDDRSCFIGTRVRSRRLAMKSLKAMAPGQLHKDFGASVHDVQATADVVCGP